MKVHLVVVPPGGGEADYTMNIDMPALPSAGDYISVQREGAIGGIYLIVKRRWWTVKDVETRLYTTEGDERWGSAEAVALECFPADGPHISEEHKRTLEMYEARGKGRLSFDVSMY